MSTARCRTLRRSSSRIVIAMCVAGVPSGATAQARAASQHTRSCDRLTTTEITFGQTGGNIRPSALRVGVDGIVTRAGDTVSGSPAIATISPDALRGVVRLALTNGFTKLPTSPTRPTRNPDAARDFIELRSPCGNKHVEYAAGEGASPFRELFALLTGITATRR